MAKIKYDYCFFTTELGDFFLLNTEKDVENIEIFKNIIYIKQLENSFTTGIKIPENKIYKLLGNLFKIDHKDIFQDVLRYNLVQYYKTPIYLWSALDTYLNRENVTVLESLVESGKFPEYKLYENPFLFKIFNR
ncbi:hypothetical protein [Chryseobacterium sp. MMS23-Vi53]|uniref:hypothetical protein n=1 Tax=Chryseobacterium sp. MMS23-Vi53 TaxID=3386644 RepID=UPI0039ED7731